VIVERAARCDECQVALEWDGLPRAKHPFIRPGDPLLYFDLSRMPLPGQANPAGTLGDGTRFEQTPQGSMVHVVPKRAIECLDKRLRARDACVRAAFIALDPGLWLGCMARIERLSTVTTQYLFVVDASSGRMRLTRGFSGSKETDYADLLPSAPTVRVAPPGAPNVIELRVQGPTLEARVNDVHVATVHDPVLGIGAFGLRASASANAPGPQRVLVQWFEVRQVIA
jgi:hypothetical protein